MDNKCFITKYQSSVENDNLPYYGAIVMHCPKITDNTTDIMTNRAISITITEKVEGQRAVIVKGSHFTNYDNTEDRGKTIEFKADVNNTFYTPNEDTVIVFYGCKYAKNINRIALNDYIHSPDRNISYFDISELKYLTNLITLQVFAHNFQADNKYNKTYGDISSLSNLTMLKTLRLDSTNITGTISSLSNLTMLNKLSVSRTGVTGDISSLSNLTMLNELSVSRTGVTGDITGIVNNCTKLVSLGIPTSVTITDEQKKTLTDRGCTLTIQ